MAIIPLDDPTQTAPRIAVLQLGFRIFFLSAAVSGILLMLTWIASLESGFRISSIYHGSFWHSHEMLFGYTAAVIAGFLLTAVKNWTGIQTANGLNLALLALLWLTARILPLLNISPVIIATVSLLFFPTLALAIAIPLVKSGNKGNLVFIPLLLLFSVAEGIFQAGINGMISWGGRAGIHMALNLVIILIVLMGGRVIPFFIERGTAQQAEKQGSVSEKVMYASLAAWAILDIAPAVSQDITSALILVAGVLQLWRARLWHIKKLWHIPMLWILYTGYLWIGIGLVLQGLNHWLGIAPSLATHALTSGAIGIITLGMMSRVAMGHTGRNIMHNRTILSAFILICLTPVARVIWPAIQPEAYNLALRVSATLWIAAFSLFTLAIAGMLLKPRVDGRPG